MAFPQRYLAFLLALVSGLFAASRTCAQPAPEQPVVFRTIAVGAAVSGLYYETSPGKSVSVDAGGASLSIPYVRPADGLVSFYREVPSKDPGGKPVRVPVADVHLGKEGPYLVVLASAPDESGTLKIQPTVIDDSWTAHPLGTVRVFNFSRRHAAVMVSKDTVEMDPNQAHVFTYPPGKGSYRFKVALIEANGWVLRVSCPQGIIPGTRSTLVMTDVQPTEDEPHPVDVNITNVFDFSKPPPKPDR